MSHRIGDNCLDPKVFSSSISNIVIARQTVIMNLKWEYSIIFSFYFSGFSSTSVIKVNFHYLAENMTSFRQALYGVQNMVIWNFTYCVDSFFVLGGFLVTYLGLKTLNKTKGRRHWWDYCMIYINRYIRLVQHMK